MATRTTTTRTTKGAFAPSADLFANLGHADFSFEELAQAYFDCRQRKRTTHSALNFEFNLEKNLIQLYDDLRNNTYQPGRSICFVVTHPKPREVWAAEFRDRIVHHLLYNKIASRFENSFIADSSACIAGRGTLYGAKRLENKIRSITHNWQKPAHYLKLDLANFFICINKNILFAILRKKITEPWWQELTALILFHDPRKHHAVRGQQDLFALVPPHKQLAKQPSHLGLPIGNLSSQFFANVYMNELDQFVKHQLKIKHYCRYVDDMVLLHESTQALNSAQQHIEQFLKERLHLTINPSKTILQPIDRGVDFVGQVIKPWRRITRKRTLHHLQRQALTTPHEKLRDTANSYFGLLRQVSHSHHHRAKLAKCLFLRGRAVDKNLTKIFGAGKN